MSCRWYCKQMSDLLRRRTVEKSSRYSCGTVIHRKRKRMRKSPSVCSRVVDFHCGRGTTSFVVTAEDVHPAIQCAGRGFLSPHRHRGAQVPSATVLRSAGAREYNAQQTENGSGKILSHGELIQYFLQESRGKVPSKCQSSEDRCLSRRMTILSYRSFEN
jgi:hypothetical protein